MRIKIINLDMDGTLADFYNVPGWLHSLHTQDINPYVQAKPMVDCERLTALLNILQAERGYTLRIITHTSYVTTPEYDAAIKEAKLKWLARYLPNVIWDEFYLISADVPKQQVGIVPGGILFDDNDKVRSSWGEGAYTETEIFEVLELLTRLDN